MSGGFRIDGWGGNAPDSALTAGTLTYSSNALVRRVWHKFAWTNAMVVALGAGTDLTVCTLPAKTVVTAAYIVIVTAANQAATLTVSLGRTSAAYVDYVVASNAKSAANTVYGDALAEIGANLYDTTNKTMLYDLPSYTATTAVKLQFLIGAGTNADVTSSTGVVYLETATLP